MTATGLNLPNLLQRALASNYLVLSSAGKHARQAWQQIINNTIADIGQVGHTV
jgi:hypothetical protein